MAIFSDLLLNNEGLYNYQTREREINYNREMQNLILEIYKNYVEQKREPHKKIYVFQHYETNRILVARVNSPDEAVYKLMKELSKDNVFFMADFISSLQDEPYCFWYRENGDIVQEEDNFIDYSPTRLSELFNMATWQIMNEPGEYLFDYRFVDTHII